MTDQTIADEARTRDDDEAGEAVPPALGRYRIEGVIGNSDSDCVLEDLAFDLEAGTHRIVVRNREQAAATESAPRLAAFVVTSDPDYAPQ